jgi:hypothetical protein
MKITFNHREYTRVDEIPPEDRALYERAMASLGAGGASDVKVHTKAGIIVNGQEYASIDAVPADVRRLYDLATSVAERKVWGWVTPFGWLVAGIVLGGFAAAALSGRSFSNRYQTFPISPLFASAIAPSKLASSRARGA